MPLELFKELGLSLLLGLLVGMQRERVEDRVAGIRTFPLVTLLGTVCAVLAGPLGGWVVGAGLAGVAAATVIGNLHRGRDSDAERGVTTEIAMLLMYSVGAALGVGQIVLGIVVGGGVALLLHLKPELHGFTQQLKQEDVSAIMQFVLIAGIILPVLPDRAFGPYNVVNPHDIWTMVVLIVGISLGGYLVYRFFGQKAGILTGGLLGGVISSTATTVSFSRRSRESPEGATAAAVVVMIASTVVYARVLLEIQVVAPSFLPAAAPRILALMGVSAILCAVWWRRAQGEEAPLPEQENPAELKPAIFFGVLYAGVLLAVEAARLAFGTRGLYAVAAISGLTDMDAITLSTSRLVGTGHLAPDSGWRMIVLASMSNLAFKGAIVAMAAHRSLLRQIAVLFGICVVAGAALLLLT